jgi:hypothetical protein
MDIVPRFLWQMTIFLGGPTGLPGARESWAVCDKKLARSFAACSEARDDELGDSKASSAAVKSTLGVNKSPRFIILLDSVFILAFGSFVNRT